jgi:hypothetical protein
VLLVPLRMVAQLTTTFAAEAPEREWALIVILVVGHMCQVGPDRVTTLVVLELIESITSCLPQAIHLLVRANFDNIRPA